MVYATPLFAHIEARDLETGELIWKVIGSDQGIPSRDPRLFLYNDSLYVFNVETHILNANTGQIKQAIREEMIPSQLVGGRFYASQWVRDAETLALISELHYPHSKILEGYCEGFKVPYSFSKEQFYTVGNCKNVYALSLKNYEITWIYNSEATGETPTAVYRNRLYVLFQNGDIHALNLETGQNQGILKTGVALPGPNGYSSPLSRGIVANESVMIATFNDKNVWAFCEDPCF